MTRYAKLNALLDAVEKDDGPFDFGKGTCCVIGIGERIGALELVHHSSCWADSVCKALDLTRYQFLSIYSGYAHFMDLYGVEEALRRAHDKPFCIAYCRALIATWEAQHAVSTDYFTITESECANHS